MNFNKLDIYSFLLLLLFWGLWGGVNIFFVLIDFILNPAIAIGGFMTIEFLFIKYIRRDLLDKKHNKEMSYYTANVMYIFGALGIPIFFIGVIIQIVDLFK